METRAGGTAVTNETRVATSHVFDSRGYGNAPLDRPRHRTLVNGELRNTLDCVVRFVSYLDTKNGVYAF